MIATGALIISIWYEAGISDVTASESSMQQDKLMEHANFLISRIFESCYASSWKGTSTTTSIPEVGRG